jgi:glutamine amidotransferase
MNKIAILDLGLNNIKSIYNLCSKFYSTYIFSKPNELKKDTNILILPGNGNFGKGMEVLNNRNLSNFLMNISSEIKIIGICLGMQIFMSESDESPNIKGLSLISGKVIKIKENDNYNNPLLGWYNVKFENKEFKKFEGSFFFNNNFIVQPSNKEFIYGNLDDFPIFIISKNIYGIQFHPELSRGLGSNFLKYIIER